MWNLVFSCAIATLGFFGAHPAVNKDEIASTPGMSVEKIRADAALALQAVAHGDARWFALN
jgi:hypothetical protein